MQKLKRWLGKCISTCCLTFHNANYPPTDHQGVLLSSFLHCAILKLDLLYTNTDVNRSHQAAIQKADCPKLVKRHDINQPSKGTARPRLCWIDWTCSSPSSCRTSPGTALSHLCCTQLSCASNSTGSLGKIHILGSTERIRDAPI